MTLQKLEEALLLASSFERLPIIISYANNIDNNDWLKVLGDEWSGFDNVGQYTHELLGDTPFGDNEIRGSLPIRQLMNDEELKAYEALPDKVTVYRGCYEHNKWGLSWSLSPEIAASFPTLNRYKHAGHQPLLVKAIAQKDRIYAVKTDRGELEVITYRPKHVSTSHIKQKEG